MTAASRGTPKSRSGTKARRRVDPARRVAFDTVRAVHAQAGYANLVLADLLAQRHITGRDAAFATELSYGTLRAEGLYDQILAAAGRDPASVQPAVLDVLRLGVHQVLAMRVPMHAAVTATVDLAASAIGERVTGLVNAVLRRVASHDLAQWLDTLTEDSDELTEVAIRTAHPPWIVSATWSVLGDEAAVALAANNVSAIPTLVARPGLSTQADVVAAGATASPYSPFGATYDGNPADLELVRSGLAGVQDEGSQLVTWALTQVPAPEGPWLDLCAGPGGKAALLVGLARDRASEVVAAELHPHRAQLVRQQLRGYHRANGPDDWLVVAADGTVPAWQQQRFARVLADVPCTGLGALRRRPEARWRKTVDDLVTLVPLQQQLLRNAISAAIPGGVVAYVTCSPHPVETVEVVEAVIAELAVEVLDAPSILPEVPDARRGKYLQLWPHRHGTDAMFCALLRVQ